MLYYINLAEIAGLNNKLYVANGGDFSLSCDAYGDSNIAIVWKFTDSQGKVTTIQGTPSNYVPGEYKLPSTYTKTDAAHTDDGTYSCEVSGIPSLADSIVVDMYGK